MEGLRESRGVRDRAEAEKVLDVSEVLPDERPDEVASRRVIGELARELKMSEREAAEGVVTVINANMANAIRSRTVQKGIDPRDYALVAFGGAGPLQDRKSVV